jgi:hypothetical protein
MTNDTDAALLALLDIGGMVVYLDYYAVEQLARKVRETTDPVALAKFAREMKALAQSMEFAVNVLTGEADDA